jgi:GAF domain-containing protein
MSSDPKKPKPALDEAAFQQLLEAAHVLQEHNDQVVRSSLAAEPPKPDAVNLLAQIVETQRRIQSHSLDLSSAAALIAGQVQKLTSARGVVIAVIENGLLATRAVSGTVTQPAAPVAVKDALSARALVSGENLFVPDAAKSAELNPDLCRAQKVSSLIAVPVEHEGKVVGLLELRGEKPNAFHEHDLRTTELMAGLLREAIAQAADLEWKKTLAAERTQMLAALDQLRPQLEKLAGPAETKSAAASAAEAHAAVPSPAAPVEPPLAPSSLIESSLIGKPTEPTVTEKLPAPIIAPEDGDAEWRPITGSTCRNCGAKFAQEEFFCGSCGSALFAPEDPGADGKRSLWHLQQEGERLAAMKTAASEPATDPVIKPEAGAALPEALQAIFDQFSRDDLPSASPAHLAAAAEPQALEKPQTDLVPTRKTDEAPEPPSTPSPTPWASAANTRQWLESVKKSGKPPSQFQQLWKQHRANVYLGASILLLLAVLFSGGSNSGPGAQAGTPPQPKLSLFDQMLVSLGLAEAPTAPPVYLGNPSTQVWVDLHTALYYCPGTELYGKTPSGKYTTQRDAQQDQFEPAARKACD